MQITIKAENSMGEDIDIYLTDEAFSDRNWVSIIIDDKEIEVWIPDLQRALDVFRYPTPEEIAQNKPL